MATLGLNPSNKEFVDGKGNELAGPKCRFPTRHSLGIADWSAVGPVHLEMIWRSCRDYFLPSGQPYNRWFKPLERVLGDTGASYYERQRDACHLDLVPYATECKWSELNKSNRNSLLSSGSTTLGELLRDSSIKLLVLNGRSVVQQFQSLPGVDLQPKHMGDWTLRRGSGPGVEGIAYSGVVNRLSEILLNRDLAVIGFNHNIQAMRGINVTDVRASIRTWLGQEANRTLL